MPITGGRLSKEVVLFCLRGVEISSSIRLGGCPGLIAAWWPLRAKRAEAGEGVGLQERGSMAGRITSQHRGL